MSSASDVFAPAPPAPGTGLHPATSPAGPDAQTGTGAAIVVRDLGKRFRIYGSPWGRLGEWLTAGRIVRHQAFWALRNVDFQISRGECFGVIGPNGSGKSTLLKLLTGVLVPTEGVSQVQGRVLSLLELGTGLTLDLTGRQNIIQSAQLLGFAPAYAQQKMAQIQAFAELGEFFDRPVRIYSSGMLVRLSFSMFTAFEPDVFIVDEALSVGDIFFQQKCVERIEEMRRGGTTMLFVSHDMSAVQRLCDRAALLSEGRVQFIGRPEECVSRYYSSTGTRRRAAAAVGEKGGQGGETPVSQGATISPDVLAQMRQHDILPAARARHGDGALVLDAATFQDELGHHTLSVEMMRTAVIRVVLLARQPVTSPQVGLHLYDRLSNLVFGAGTPQLGVRIPPMQAGQRRLVTLRLGLCVQDGQYTFNLGCSEPSAEGPDIGLVHDRHEGLGPITVAWHRDGDRARPFHGLAKLPLEVLL